VRPGPEDRARWAAAALLAVALAGLAALGAPPEGFFSGDGGVKYLEVRAVLEHGPLDPWIAWPGAELDPGLELAPAFLVPRRGRLLGVFPYLYPLLVAPLLAALGGAGLRLVSAAGVGVALALAWALAAAVRPGGRPGRAAVAAVAGTPVLFHGAALWEHAPAVAGVLAAALAAERWAAGAPRGGRRAALAAGVAVGVAGGLRLEALLAGPALALAHLLWPAPRRRREAVRFWAVAGLWAAGVQAALAGWRTVYAGTPVPLQLLHNLAGAAGWGERVSRNVRELLLPARGTAVLAVALLAAAWLAVGAVRRRRGGGVAVAGGAGLAALWLGVTVGLPAARVAAGARFGEAFGYRSVAHTWPLLALLLLPWGWRWLASEAGRAARRLLVAGGVYAVGVVAAAPVPGGFQWGARLLLPAAPLLALAGLVATAAEERALGEGWRRPAAAAVTAVVAAALAVQVLGLAFLVKARRENAAVAAAVVAATAGSGAAVTDLFWVPQLAAARFGQRRFLFVRRPGDVERLARRLPERGVERVDLVTSGAEGWLGETVPGALLGAGYRPLPARRLGVRGLAVRRLVRRSVHGEGLGEVAGEVGVESARHREPVGQ